MSDRTTILIPFDETNIKKTNNALRQIAEVINNGVGGGRLLYSEGATGIVLGSEAESTSEEGRLNFDGTRLTFAPSANVRSLIPTAQMFRLNGSLAGANSTSVQSVFGVGVSLEASTVYAFEIVAHLEKTAGATSHTVSFGFGGTATLNNILFNSVYNGALTTSAATMATASAATVVVYTTAAASAATTFRLKVWGTVSVNGAGTFIPQYQLSAAPGGAYSTVAGSTMSIWPLGASGSNISIGTWA